MSSSDVKATSRMLRQISDPHTRRLFELTLLNIDILKDSLLALEKPGQPGWLDFELQNAWAQSSTIDAVLPKYHKSVHHIVYVRGVISGGTAADGTVIATLPAGFRPLRSEEWPITQTAGSSHARIICLPNGDLTIYGMSSGAEMSIAGSFFAEN